ncbi:MAG: polyribonucleotide nucleotidyltransferase, partial [Bacteroidales bacterium]|nr:polyribonucleotide nucleotidyltransferase [Bacteroidales bacterium]
MTKTGIEKSFSLKDGRTISIETGRLAKQADGAVVVRMGNTMILATVVANNEVREGFDFLPLTVEYKEKYAATGKFPGGFFKREARPSEAEILTSRLVDRALRPLFPDNWRYETQVLLSLISGEEDVAPDALAALAASAALSVSDIPFAGPISEVRVARINGEFKINPSIPELQDADIDLMVAATIDNINMVEGEMKEVSEAEMLEAVKIAHEAIKDQCNAQLELAAMVEKSKEKREADPVKTDEDIEKRLKDATYDKVVALVKTFNNNKHERTDLAKAIRDEFIESMTEEEQEEKTGMVKTYFHDMHKEIVRNVVLDDRTRLDGRKLDEIRPIWSEIDYLPSAHGSAIFTRGETQSLVTTTLGTKMDEQILDGA